MKYIKLLPSNVSTSIGEERCLMFIVKQFSAIFTFVLPFDVTTIYAGSFILKQMMWNVHTPHTPFVVPDRIDGDSESELRVRSRFKISTMRFWSLWQYYVSLFLELHHLNSSVSWPEAQEWWSLYVYSYFLLFFSCFEAIRLSHADEMNVYDKSLGKSRKRFIHKIRASQSRVLSTWRYEYRQIMCKLSDNNSWMCMCVPVGLLTTKYHIS